MAVNRKTPAKPKAGSSATRTGRKPTPADEMKSRVDKVCEMVSGGETLRAIGEAMGFSAGTILGWISDSKEFSEQYARAREAAADLFESDILHRAKNIADPAAARVEIDALKWVAARRAPKRYGDRVNHVSDDGSMTPKPAIDVSGLSDATLKELMDARRSGAK